MSRESESARERGPIPAVAWAATAIAVLGIWIVVVLASITGPDLISGSQQEHLPLVAMVDWVWGTMATAFVVLAVLQGIRRGVSDPTPWWVLAVGVIAIWLGVLVVTAFGPVLVTGSDPTSVPVGAMGAPVLGIFLTWFVCELVKAAFERAS